jgi:hypothetical protein
MPEWHLPSLNNPYPGIGDSTPRRLWSATRLSLLGPGSALLLEGRAPPSLEFLFLFLLPLLLDEEYVGVEGGLLLAVPLGDSGPEGWTRARRI